MPKIASPTYWGPTIRPYKLMTDVMEVEGRKGVLVTSSTEGFGQVQYENSRDKWIEIFKWKDIHGWKKTAPQYNSNKPDTAPFKSKWSEHKTGQGSGWDPVAISTYKQRQDAIKKWRDDDKEDDCRKMKECRLLIKVANEIEAGQTGPARKRRRVAAAAVEEEDAGEETEIELDFSEDEG